MWVITLKRQFLSYDVQFNVQNFNMLQRKNEKLHNICLSFVLRIWQNTVNTCCLCIFKF